MDLDPVSDAIVGGASLPGKVGTVSLTWPLCKLTLSESGVAVSVRSSLLSRLLRPFLSNKGDALRWEASWVDLKRVVYARRSVILMSGQASCRFVTMRHNRMNSIIERVGRHGVEGQRVSSTLGWFVRGDNFAPS